MQERSLIAYENWRESSARFDYLVLGFIGAVTAYVGQSFNPGRLTLALDSTNFEILSLVLLVSAVVFGFKRAECNVEIFRLNHSILHASEERGAMMRVIQEGRPGFNVQTGDPIDPEHAATRRAELSQEVTHYRELSDKAAVTSMRFYRIRNLFFATGFAVLLVARILAPYEATG